MNVSEKNPTNHRFAPKRTRESPFTTSNPKIILLQLLTMAPERYIDVPSPTADFVRESEPPKNPDPLRRRLDNIRIF
jgi:hypothetical protein